MMPAWSKAAEVARSKGRPTGLILTTTPSDLTNDMGQFAYWLRNNSARFNESLYDMSSDRLNRWIDANSSIGYVYIEFQYNQLSIREPNKWFEEQCKNLVYDWPKIRREVLIQWDSAATNSPFDQEDLRSLKSIQQEPFDDDSITINTFYRLNVYKKLELDKKYIIVVDPAKGRGEQADRTAVVVIDAETDECCAIFKSPTIQYKETFRFLYTLFYTYIPNSVIVIENNIDTLVEYVKNSTMKFALYYEPVKSVIKENKKKPTKTENIVYGITTTADIRPKYFDILFQMVHEDQQPLRAKELVEEIESLEAKTATRIEAVAGTHDDIVMAYLMGIYVKRFGHNRARFGLFYSDGVISGTPVKVSDNTFKSNFDLGKKVNTDIDISANSFYGELLERKVLDTDESLDYQWRKKHSADSEDDALTFITNVFTGEKDLAGIKRITNDAFSLLNARDKYGDMLSDEDAFGTHMREIDDSDSVGSFF